MSIAKQPAELAQYLKSKKNVLLLSGWLCDTVELDGRKLFDYLVEIAIKLDVPVAATANTAMGMKERGLTKTKKMWLSEVIEYLHRGEWRDEYMRKIDPEIESLMPERPEVVVLIGYNPQVSDWAISGFRGVETVALTPGMVERATYCLPETTSLRQWQKLLDELTACLS